MKSRISENSKKWSIDLSKVSESQKAVLEAVGFPLEGKISQALQRRVKKQNINKGFFPNPNATIEDVSYIVVPKTTAINQILRYEKRLDANRRTYSDISEKEFLALNKSRDYEMIYCDGVNIESELDWLFGKFAAPALTPSAKAEQTGSKKLTKKQKDLINKLVEEGNAADEIAEQTGLEVTLIIEHLKSLKDGKE